MLKARREAVEMVAQKLHKFEAALDEALRCGGELTASIPQARAHAKLSPMVADSATTLVGEALAVLHGARAKTVASHHAFAEVNAQLGLKTYAGGDLWKLADEEDPRHLVLASNRA